MPVTIDTEGPRRFLTSNSIAGWRSAILGNYAFGGNAQALRQNIAMPSDAGSGSILVASAPNCGKTQEIVTRDPDTRRSDPKTHSQSRVVSGGRKLHRFGGGKLHTCRDSLSRVWPVTQRARNIYWFVIPNGAYSIFLHTNYRGVRTWPLRLLRRRGLP